MALTGYPDGQPKSFPNQDGGSNLSSGAFGRSFGFNAALVKFANDGPGPAYITLGGTASSQASTGTGTWILTTGDLLTDIYDIGVPVSGFAYVTSSSGGTLRWAAWG